MTRRSTAPRISEAAAKFYPTVFSSLNAGMQYAGDSYPVLYRRTLHELRGKFTRGELSLMIDVFNATALLPEIAGQHLAASVADGIDLDHLDEKWEIDGAELNRKISGLTIFESASLELWANGFWYRQKAEEPLDLEKWLKQLI